jgi:hypothetical protein
VKEIIIRIPADATLTFESAVAPRSGINPLVFGLAPRYHAGGIVELKPEGVPAILRREEVRACFKPVEVEVAFLDGKPAPRPRFIKLDGAGAELPADAKQWAAVFDRSTGLMWSAENVGNERLNHEAATKACAELQLCGLADWRLPTRAELLTLVDDTRHEPAIALEFFPTCRSSWYWTSTPAAWSPSACAWIVHFSLGNAYYYPRNHGAFVRAVRSVGASPGQ